MVVRLFGLRFRILLVALMMAVVPDHVLAADHIAGSWDLYAYYSASLATPRMSANDMTLAQDGDNISGKNVAISNDKQPGFISGKIIGTGGRVGLIMISLKRVDERTRYTALLIGYLSEQGESISGFFIDSNGVHGKFVANKKSA